MKRRRKTRRTVRSICDVSVKPMNKITITKPIILSIELSQSMPNK